jgi:hypothetical protein
MDKLNENRGEALQPISLVSTSEIPELSFEAI